MQKTPPPKTNKSDCLKPPGLAAILLSWGTCTSADHSQVYGGVCVCQKSQDDDHNHATQALPIFMWVTNPLSADPLSCYVPLCWRI